MQCPTCNVTLAMTHRQGIEIDYCPQCRGIWLDRGELDKLIEREAETVAPAQPSRDTRQQTYPEQRYGGHHAPRPYKKKKSLLSEIFDI